MPYVVTKACIDEMDRSCVEVCPVDCIYEGLRKSYINARECIDCGACQSVCPAEAIYQDRELPDELHVYVEDSERFFIEPLAGRSEALGTPGGAQLVGALGVDTELVASKAPR